jgi:hypothetical protein
VKNLPRRKTRPQLMLEKTMRRTRRLQLMLGKALNKRRRRMNPSSHTRKKLANGK